MEEETCGMRGGRYEATGGGKDAERWENGLQSRHIMEPADKMEIEKQRPKI